MATDHINPIRTSDQYPRADVDGVTVFAWSDTFKDYVIVSAKTVAQYPKNYTHWLPLSVLPRPDEVTK
ncbi:hypothetical protein [Noviherbaspirillum sp. Root189]|uniref:hypothetical protein n=1 Tax=Noviherbaspirillum sp. Root189 TaxID=1736487 RepID=UPI00070B2CA3|nr:hypothetical protein [Noviherbaspirillum sp. Root189]KRB73473.1 hypothetical protein ASE07_06365 [Noviherbaspirillum sp. Root189]